MPISPRRTATAAGILFARPGWGTKPGGISEGQWVVVYITVAIVALGVGSIGNVRIGREHAPRDRILHPPVHVVHAHPEPELRLERVALSGNAGSGGQVRVTRRTGPGGGIPPLPRTA